MPIKNPDLLTHNNPQYPIITVDDILGITIVDTLTDRDSISSFRRRLGHIVNVRNNSVYRYAGATTDNSAWVNTSNWTDMGTGTITWSMIQGTDPTANTYLAATLNTKVDKATTVNGHTLSSNVTVTASDVNAIPVSEKGAASGVVPLNSSTKIDATYLPPISVVDYLGSVASQSAMLALVGQSGDWCIRTDTSTVWIITGNDPTQLSSWTQLAYPVSPVNSVNGQTGAVTITPANINAVATDASNLSTQAQKYTFNEAYIRYISTSIDIYFNSSTGSDTTGNGTAGTPYATLDKCLIDIAYATITNNAIVSLIHAGGAITYTATSNRLLNTIVVQSGFIAIKSNVTTSQVTSLVGSYDTTNTCKFNITSATGFNNTLDQYKYSFTLASDGDYYPIVESGNDGTNNYIIVPNGAPSPTTIVTLGGNITFSDTPNLSTLPSQSLLFIRLVNNTANLILSNPTTLRFVECKFDTNFDVVGEGFFHVTRSVSNSTTYSNIKVVANSSYIKIAPTNSSSIYQDCAGLFTSSLAYKINELSENSIQGTFGNGSTSTTTITPNAYITLGLADCSLTGTTYIPCDNTIYKGIYVYNNVVKTGQESSLRIDKLILGKANKFSHLVYHPNTTSTTGYDIRIDSIVLDRVTSGYTLLTNISKYEYNNFSKDHKIIINGVFDDISRSRVQVIDLISESTLFGSTNTFIAIAENGKIYNYILNGSSYSVDGNNILNTFDGGNTRWLSTEYIKSLDTLYAGTILYLDSLYSGIEDGTITKPFSTLDNALLFLKGKIVVNDITFSVSNNLHVVSSAVIRGYLANITFNSKVTFLSNISQSYIGTTYTLTGTQYNYSATPANLTSENLSVNFIVTNDVDMYVPIVKNIGNTVVCGRLSSTVGVKIFQINKSVIIDDSIISVIELSNRISKSIEWRFFDFSACNFNNLQDNNFDYYSSLSNTKFFGCVMPSTAFTANTRIFESCFFSELFVDSNTSLKNCIIKGITKIYNNSTLHLKQSCAFVANPYIAPYNETFIDLSSGSIISSSIDGYYDVFDNVAFFDYADTAIKFDTFITYGIQDISSTKNIFIREAYISNVNNLLENKRTYNTNIYIGTSDTCTVNDYSYPCISVDDNRYINITNGQFPTSSEFNDVLWTSGSGVPTSTVSSVSYYTDILTGSLYFNPSGSTWSKFGLDSGTVTPDAIGALKTDYSNITATGVQNAVIKSYKGTLTGRDYYVNVSTGSDTTGNGTNSLPYQTIERVFKDWTNYALSGTVPFNIYLSAGTHTYDEGKLSFYSNFINFTNVAVNIIGTTSTYGTTPTTTQWTENTYTFSNIHNIGNTYTDNELQNKIVNGAIVNSNTQSTGFCVCPTLTMSGQTIYNIDTTIAPTSYNGSADIGLCMPTIKLLFRNIKLNGSPISIKSLSTFNNVIFQNAIEVINTTVYFDGCIAQSTILIKKGILVTNKSTFNSSVTTNTTSTFVFDHKNVLYSHIIAYGSFVGVANRARTISPYDGNQYRNTFINNCILDGSIIAYIPFLELYNQTSILASNPLSSSNIQINVTAKTNHTVTVPTYKLKDTKNNISINITGIGWDCYDEYFDNIIATKSELSLLGTTNAKIYYATVKENGLSYMYVASGSSYTVDGTYVLNTAEAGNTRWISTLLLDPKSGFQIVANITGRNNIVLALRKIGFVCSITGDNVYRYTGSDVTNTNWTNASNWTIVGNAVPIIQFNGVAQSSPINITPAAISAINTSQLGIPYGVATLDSAGIVAQLPTLFSYRNTFVPNSGYPSSPLLGYYIASADGTAGGVKYKTGDFAFYNGSGFNKNTALESSGVANLLQLSDGYGGLTSNSSLSYATSTLMNGVAANNVSISTTALSTTTSSTITNLLSATGTSYLNNLAASNLVIGGNAGDSGYKLTVKASASYANPLSLHNVTSQVFGVLSDGQLKLKVTSSNPTAETGYSKLYENNNLDLIYFDEESTPYKLNLVYSSEIFNHGDTLMWNSNLSRFVANSVGANSEYVHKVVEIDFCKDIDGTNNVTVLLPQKSGYRFAVQSITFVVKTVSHSGDSVIFSDIDGVSGWYSEYGDPTYTSAPYNFTYPYEFSTLMVYKGQRNDIVFPNGYSSAYTIDMSNAWKIATTTKSHLTQDVVYCCFSGFMLQTP